MDCGPSPEKNFSDEYQCGALSFEILLSNKKLICNSGYFQNYNQFYQHEDSLLYDPV